MKKLLFVIMPLLAFSSCMDAKKDDGGATAKPARADKKVIKYFARQGSNTDSISISETINKDSVFVLEYVNASITGHPAEFCIWSGDNQIFIPSGGSSADNKVTYSQRIFFYAQNEIKARISSASHGVSGSIYLSGYMQAK